MSLVKSGRDILKGGVKALQYGTAAYQIAKNSMEAAKVGTQIGKTIRSAFSKNTDGGSNSWSKFRSKKRKRRVSRRVKRRVKRRKALVRLVKKVMAPSVPTGTFTYICAGKVTLSRVKQSILSSDGAAQPLCIGDPRQICDAAAYLFKAKAAGGWNTLTGNFPLATKLNVKKMDMTIRIYNQTLYPVEIDVYEATGKNNSTLQFKDSWLAGYDNQNYRVDGTTGYTGTNNAGNKAEDFYATAGESKMVWENFNYTKKTIYLLPGEKQLYYVKGKTGLFDVQKYVQPTSTKDTPVFYQTIPGWYKQILFVARGQMMSVNEGTAPTITMTTLHPLTVKGQIIVDVKKVYTLDAPEGTEDAQNIAQRKKQIYYAPVTGVADDVQINYNGVTDAIALANK